MKLCATKDITTCRELYKFYLIASALELAGLLTVFPRGILINERVELFADKVVSS